MPNKRILGLFCRDKWVSKIWIVGPYIPKDPPSTLPESLKEAWGQRHNTFPAHLTNFGLATQRSAIFAGDLPHTIGAWGQCLDLFRVCLGDAGALHLAGALKVLLFVPMFLSF